MTNEKELELKIAALNKKIDALNKNLVNLADVLLLDSEGGPLPEEEEQAVDQCTDLGDSEVMYN